MPRREPPLWNDRPRSRSPLPEASTAPSSRVRPHYGASDPTDGELQSHHRNILAPTIQDEAEDDSDEDGDTREIIMAVDQRGSKMGCAYYTAAESKLCVFDDLGVSVEDYFEACEFLPPGCGREYW